MDVVTAFFNLALQEEVYIELPKGYTILKSYTIPYTSRGKVIYRLWKCLYSLKQAPRAWYTNIDAYLIGTLSFIYFKEDYNLYISKQVLLLLFVDDILLFSSKLDIACEIKALLSSKYKMLDLGPI
jgi:Reverse transcriptase (RNA-dependent DNA polymerase)